MGTATALQLKHPEPGLELRLIEKEVRVDARESSPSNSVHHAGRYYKSRLLRRARDRRSRQMVAFGSEHDNTVQNLRQSMDCYSVRIS
jgi:L-2-hydroxyglutarate oxidase LhgO